jgi:hypothetical protein
VKGASTTERSRWHPSLVPLVSAVVVVLLVAACGGDDPATSGERAETDTPPVTAGAYAVAAGDFLSGIADAHCVSLAELTELNGWADGANHPIFPGDEVQIPPGGCTPNAEQPRPTSADDGAAPTETEAGEDTVPVAASLTDGGFVTHFGDPSMLFDEDSFDSPECFTAWSLFWSLNAGQPLLDDGSLDEANAVSAGQLVDAVDALPGDPPPDVRESVGREAAFMATYGLLDAQMWRNQILNDVDVRTSPEFAQINAAFDELGDAAGATHRYLDQICPQVRFPDS